MVRNCSQTNYPEANEQKYKSYFELFPFPLSIFQKYAIEAIVDNQHVLITAPTGSGKTLPAEFAIRHITNNNKKIIYTCPIKALANQKYNEFKNKFPDLDIGLITGDIKINPNANVLVMITEVLCKTLTIRNNETTQVGLQFSMNIENDLQCVVFDEVHYINDTSRGSIWEETMLLLPSTVQMIMLSATLDNPVYFAKWCENISNNRIVYISSVNIRSVPLTHYAFLSGTKSSVKSIKIEQDNKFISKYINKLLLIQNASNDVCIENKNIISQYLHKLQQHNIRISPTHLLNNLVTYLIDHQMTPAICFVFSQKQTEIFARSITIPLTRDEDNDVFNQEQVSHECDQLIRKFPNYNEYLNLPEYINLVNLIRKRIAIHHAGMLPIFRELVEIMFSRGYIKLLFATETFAIGINMPTKTVIFTSTDKFDGGKFRQMFPHEYTQMAGRAGRRGIDIVGNVIHLPNLYRAWDNDTISMMKPSSPKLVSKFNISSDLVLSQINQEMDVGHFIKQSMMGIEINSQCTNLKNDINNYMEQKNNLADTLTLSNIPTDIMDEYIHTTTRMSLVDRNQQKKCRKILETIVEKYPTISDGVKSMSQYNTICNALNDSTEQLRSQECIISTTINNILQDLISGGFVKSDADTNIISLTAKGEASVVVKEISGYRALSIIDIISSLDADTCILLFSIFTDNSSNATTKLFQFSDDDRLLIYEIVNLVSISTDDDNYNTTMIPYIHKWISCTSESECREIMQSANAECDISLGKFIKSLIKVVI